MKMYLLLFFAAMTVISTTAIGFFTKKNTVYIVNPDLDKKRFVLRCSPSYIPGDELIPPLQGWGTYKWKVTTVSDSAQFYFNQGINMYYAFHIIESRASFDKATRFDPLCAMAWWGKALAFGPNINDFGYQRPSEAYASAFKANSLKKPVTALEKALIEAITIRYTNDSTVDQSVLNKKYKTAMKGIYGLFNHNADVAALYTDALMLLHPWDLYYHDFKPKQWTPEINAVIKHGLQLSPFHPGVNHYQIHAVEASANPEVALKAAKFLASAMPGVSHITHMPSHIYIRTGYYDKGINVNDKAVEGYQNYLSSFPAVAENISLYSIHNLHMKMACAHMAGNYRQAIQAANDLQLQIPDMYLTMGGALGNYVQYLHQSPLMTYIRFGKWNEILKEQLKDSLTFTPVLQHFARGLAFTRLNRLKEASSELVLLKNKLQVESSLKEPLAPFNSTYDAGLIGQYILEGVIAAAQKNYTKGISLLQEAVKAEDQLIYNEPRDWLLPARHYLADVLFQAGKNKETVEVLKKDLQINPHNGWALTGIMNAYRKNNKLPQAISVEKQVKQAWLIKDLSISNVVF